MPTEPKLNDDLAVSAIENEIPAYRAISPMAVVALILGVLSVLSFASWYFLVFSGAAVLLGFLADRKIQRFPDALTGRGLAQAGVGLGLIFGLTAVSVITIQGVLRVNQAKAFARLYQDVLQKGTFAQAVWYGQSPQYRAAKTPEEALEEVSKSGSAATFFEDHYSGIRAVKRILAESNGDIHFLRVESHGEQELVDFVGVVYQIHAPDSKESAAKDQLALAVLKGTRSKNGRIEWMVSDFAFPYKDKSFVAPAPEKKDDGHGHGH